MSMYPVLGTLVPFGIHRTCRIVAGLAACSASLPRKSKHGHTWPPPRARVDTVQNRPGNFENVKFWAGLRPATPSNIPYLGRTKRYRNLWLNTGHGTLGWTMSAGSGKRIAYMVVADDGAVVA